MSRLRLRLDFNSSRQLGPARLAHWMKGRTELEMHEEDEALGKKLRGVPGGGRGRGGVLPSEAKCSSGPVPRLSK